MFRGIKEELDWFLSGKTDIKILQEKNIHIWDDNLKGFDDPGPIYGHQFRHFGEEYIDCKHNYTKGVDQIQYVIDMLKNRPDSRRILINLWNPQDVPKMCLPPCHVMYQFITTDNKYLTLCMTQRSGDVALGIPFNIASASLLTHIIAKETGLIPHEFIHTINDCHIYKEHIPNLMEQIKRKPFKFPRVDINNYPNIKLIDYKSHGKIRFNLIT